MFLYTPDAIYAAEKAAAENTHLTQRVLMQRAGERVWCRISTRWPELSRITLFVGSGNNGGDAFLVATLARQQGLGVQLIAVGNFSRQSEASAYYRQLWQQTGGVIESWEQQPIEGDLIVDGLLGIGLNRMLSDDWQDLIGCINHSLLPVVAIDIPSGLSATTGVAQPCAVAAEMTVALIGRQQGHYLADGPDYCGELVFDNLGVSPASAETQAPTLEVMDETNLQLPKKRQHNVHKNSFGHVLVVGGDRGMAGAAALAAQAALRAGAGVVSLCVHPDCVQALAVHSELMVYDWDLLPERLEQASVLVLGPGLGQSVAAQMCLHKLQAATQPVVVDAGALVPEFLTALASQQVVLTPHPGEAARLLGLTVREVQSDRMMASAQLSERFSAVSVLKGSGTLVRESIHAHVAVNLRGNPGLASAGTGDVLAGMIAGFIGQQMPLFEAARTGVFAQALCAEDFASKGDESGLIASDLIHRIPVIMKQLRHA